MAKHEVAASDREIEAALDRAKQHGTEPVAQTVQHISGLNLLIVGLSNHRRLVLPVEEIQGLGAATHEQMQHYELLGRGTGISFPELDVDLYVPALIQGVYGNNRWMARLGQGGSGVEEAVVGKTARVIEEVLIGKRTRGETSRSAEKLREKR